MLTKNCEHFANMMIYGVDYSKQVKDCSFGSRFCINCFVCKNNDGSISRSGNNDKGNKFKLANEMEETNDRLGCASNWHSNEMEARVEVPPKENCVIM